MSQGKGAGSRILETTDVAKVMKNAFVRSGLLALGILWATTYCACTPRSYPADRLKESLQKICRDEYGIEDVDAKVVDKTIGVYLPLNKLFITDFGDVLKGGKIKNIDSLFEPSPEALDKVEDVLFSLSRIILSTDRPLEFYVLQATDVAKTGLQLTLTGYIDDIKRVRLWDISRNEYRKRVLHELRLNQAVLWHRPVRAFFENLERMKPAALLENYFVRDATVDMIQLFYDRPDTDVAPETAGRSWELLDIRSMDLDRQSAAVYVKTKPGGSLATAVPPDTNLEYLFLMTQDIDQARILRIIPFQYRESDGSVHKIEFPQDLKIDENLAKWREEFMVESIKLGPFLSMQLTRRMQNIIFANERIRNTFRQAKVEFQYVDESMPHRFTLDLDVQLRQYAYIPPRSLVFHEDVLYLLELASREFSHVMRGYQFADYEYLGLSVPPDPTEWVLKSENLELFRKNKIDIQGLLTTF